MKMVSITANWRLLEPQAGQAFEQHLQCNLKFKPREWCADTEMNTRSE